MSDPIIIIPARADSSRLPRKMLLDETGISLLQHTYENAMRSGLEVVVAGDKKCCQEVAKFGGKFTHVENASCGTERCMIAAERRGHYGPIINIQGDSPEFPYDEIEKLLDCRGPIVTGHYEVGSTDANDENVCKLVLGANNEVMYFSRARIPHRRGIKLRLYDTERYLAHIGVYLFKDWQLVSDLYKRDVRPINDEQLEQLMWLEQGIRIQSVEMKMAPSVDTRYDYDKFTERLYSSGWQRPVRIRGAARPEDRLFPRNREV